MKSFAKSFGLSGQKDKPSGEAAKEKQGSETKATEKNAEVAGSKPIKGEQQGAGSAITSEETATKGPDAKWLLPKGDTTNQDFQV